MQLSARLKNWLISNMEIKATSSDDEFRKAVGDAITSGELTTQKLIELTTTKEAEEADEFTTTLKSLKDAVSDLKTALSESDDDVEIDDDDVEEEVEEKATKTKVKGKKKPAPKFVDEDEEEEMDDEDEEEEKASKKKSVSFKTKSSKPSNLSRLVADMGGTPEEDDEEEKEFKVRVKSVAERYSTTKSAMTYPMVTARGKAHPLAGRPVVDYTEGSARSLDNPSELDKAVAGAYAKFAVSTARKGGSRTMAYMSLPQHDKEMLHYAMDNSLWGGATDGGDEADIKNRKLTPHEQKALIDDSVSGGLEAAPIVFDDQVIQTPLLHGELYPLVNTVPIDRGRRIEGFATGTVTGSWGGVDDSAIALFNTASYVTAFDTTIFRWEGAIQVGLDFLSDTPIDFGAHLTTQYGERLLEDLDDVIATGNGTTQPEGITVKSGTTSIAFGGSTSIGNYESLRFGVAKPEHRANLVASAVFCGTETSYQRARAIPVGANDARRLGGSLPSIGGIDTYGSYQWMGIPYKINESMGNTKLFYAILQRYRMYRRRGLTMRTSTEGSTLMRANEMLIIATARYGGQLERGACAAVTSTAPA